jgi:hypothetical protein
MATERKPEEVLQRVSDVIIVNITKDGGQGILRREK